jgi:hypothetical protein
MVCQVRLLAVLAGVSLGCSEDVSSLHANGANGMLRFDGQDDYATFPTSGFPTALGPQAITLFFRSARVVGAQCLVRLSRWDSSGVSVGLSGATPTAWRVRNPETFAMSQHPIETGRWYHLAYTFDGTQHQMFIDGELVGIGTTHANNRTPTLGWLGACDAISEHFNGEIDDVRIWAETRTQAAIDAERAGLVDDTSPGLLAHWSFDEPFGSRVFDASPLRNHATLGDGTPSNMPQRAPSDRAQSQ